VSGNKLEYVNETMPSDERKDGLDQKRIHQISIAHTCLQNTQRTEEQMEEPRETPPDTIQNS